MLLPAIKFTHNQRSKMRSIAGAEKAPTIDDIFKVFPNFSKEKHERALYEVKKLRRKMAQILGITDVKGIQNPKLFGSIYLVVNEKFDGWVKCGMTTNIEKRLCQYNTYDPTLGFKLVESKNVEDRRKSETALIRWLRNEAISSKGEWFQIETGKAVEIFRKI